MTEINLVSRTQIIDVIPETKTVSLINAGPQGPRGVGPDGAEWDVTGSHITGEIVEHDGPIHTAHDWFDFDLDKMKGNATFVDNGATIHAPAYWSFVDSATRWVKWQWKPGDGWQGYDIRFGILFPGGTTPANGRWRYSEERYTVNSGSPAGVLTATPVEVASVTIASPAALGQGNFYGNLAVGVVSPGPFDYILSTIERVPGHAGDDQSGDLGIFSVTGTRVAV